MKRTLTEEMDQTQAAVSQIVCWCCTIALHQDFGVGRQRLDKISERIHQLEEENTAVIMTPDEKGLPSNNEAWAIRESWLAGIVDSEYHVPKLRTPKNRREEQLTIAADTAAKIAWQLYAKAVIDVLHYGAERMKRLKEKSRANYEQLNQWSHEVGLDVGMERLRRCAADAMRDESLTLVDVADDKAAEKVEREFQEQKRIFQQRAALKRVKMKAPLNVMAAGSVEKMAQNVMQQMENVRGRH